jgi:hypothetical protein
MLTHLTLRLNMAISSPSITVTGQLTAVKKNTGREDDTFKTHLFGLRVF